MNRSHNFAMVPQVKYPRSSFDLSHGHKTTFDAGKLIPFYHETVYPGDTIALQTHGFCRLATPLYPYMDNAYMETFYFFIPHRLVWDNFVRMMGEQDNPTDTIDYLFPILDNSAAYNIDEGSLFSYLGVPTNLNIGDATYPVEVVSVKFRAYNLTINKWFKNENLEDDLPVPKDDGPDDPDDFVVVRRCKRPDYFVSCLPSPQKGDPVAIPLGGTAPVVSTGQQVKFSAVDNTQTNLGFNADVASGGASFTYVGGSTLVAQKTLKFGDVTGLEADLSTVSNGLPLNAFRYAIAVQTLLERDMRGGTRYTESNFAHFGVISDDARLQRPEYLGGGSSPLNVHPVASTTGVNITGNTSTVKQVGELGAFVTSSLRGFHGFTRSFTEHGSIIGLVNVRADITYQNGLNKDYSRRSRLDMYYPALSQIGEQPVYKREILCVGGATDAQVFGYQEPYADLRYRPSYVTGKFNSYCVDPLDAWHLALDFGASVPSLGPTFIKDNPPFDRVIIVESGNEPQLIGDFWHQVRAARVMPLYGVPASLSHF